VLSEENHMLTTNILKESICSVNENEESTSSIIANKSTDPACDQVTVKVNNDDQEKYKGTVLPPKRTQRPPQQRERNFCGRFMTSGCL
jgi:hypothetical protein